MEEVREPVRCVALKQEVRLEKFVDDPPYVDSAWW